MNAGKSSLPLLKKLIMAFKTRTIRVPLFRPDPTAHFAKPRPVKVYGPSERSERLSPASEASTEPESAPLSEIYPFETLGIRRPPSPTPRVLYKTYTIPDFETEPDSPPGSSHFPLRIYSYWLEKPIEAKLA